MLAILYCLDLIFEGTPIGAQWLLPALCLGITPVVGDIDPCHVMN